jgi:periplasmic mercuric ion binding protein
MPKIIRYAALVFGLASSSVAFAGEKTVTLAVENMYCADCPFIVKKSLEGFPVWPRLWCPSKTEPLS